MINLSQIKKNPQVQGFIEQTEKALEASGYTEHSIEHANIVAERAKKIAKKIGLPEKEQRLASIAGFCHDMGNFLSRDYHNYLTALLFHQIFEKDFTPSEMAILMQAIANHDKEEMNFSTPVAAVLVLADKSDVRRSRVVDEEMEDIKADIHDRVNYATKDSNLKIDNNKKRITLTLDIDSKFVPIMEYFEIFTDRMVYCRKAAKYLNYQFGLVINKFKLL